MLGNWKWYGCHQIGKCSAHSTTLWKYSSVACYADEAGIALIEYFEQRWEIKWKANERSTCVAPWKGLKVEIFVIFIRYTKKFRKWIMYRKWEKIEILLSEVSAILLELLKSSPFGENVIFFSKQNQSFLNLYMIGTLCSGSGKVITDPDLMSITGPGLSCHHILTLCLMRSQTTRLF